MTASNIPMIIISLALLFYSIGVWSERISTQLKTWHLVFFWLGLICDTWGTGLMLEMAGGLTFDIHGLTGLIAILLILVPSVFAQTPEVTNGLRPPNNIISHGSNSTHIYK